MTQQTPPDLGGVEPRDLVQHHAADAAASLARCDPSVVSVIALVACKNKDGDKIDVVHVWGLPPAPAGMNLAEQTNLRLMQMTAGNHMTRRAIIEQAQFMLDVVRAVDDTIVAAQLEGIDVKNQIATHRAKAAETPAAPAAEDADG